MAKFYRHLLTMIATLCCPAACMAVDTVLHQFVGGADDGRSPNAELIVSGAKLYGMTMYGGVKDCGTIFSMNTDGSDYRLLHDFIYYPADGGLPYGGLTLSGSTLYGTTSAGGTSSSFGTVFAMEIDGSNYRPLHQFDINIAPYGTRPTGTLAISGSTVFGMTCSSNHENKGIIYSVDANTGDFRTLHVFGGWTKADGNDPNNNSLTLSQGTLYGMTQDGGVYADGTVFSLLPDGSNYRVLHHFSRSTSDGERPNDAPVVSGSTLYGTTRFGGKYNKGIVFAMNTDGTNYRVFHDFAGGTNDGDTVVNGLSLAGDTLYGMTCGGGERGNGTVFSLRTDGTGFQIIHSLYGGTQDGRAPNGSIVFDQGMLYGMTRAGGTGDNGVVFSVQVPEPSTLALFGIGALGLLAYGWRRWKQ